MTNEEIKQHLLDRSEVNKQVMRDIHALCEKLDESAESNFIGCDGDWEYKFIRRKQKGAQ